MKLDIIIQWVRADHTLRQVQGKFGANPTYSKFNQQGSSELHVQNQ